MFLLAATAAIASLTLGMATDNAVADGYLKTRAATAGPDTTAVATAPGRSPPIGMMFKRLMFV